MTEAPSIEGLWTYPSRTFPGHDDYISIDETRGRLFTFITSSITPVRYVSFECWYRLESAHRVTTRRRGSNTWLVYEIRHEGDRLVWTYGAGEHPWRRVPAHERPDWLDARLARANAKMDAAEVEP